MTNIQKVKILSIDGGGIRGIIPGTILDHIEQRIQTKLDNPDTRLADHIDFIAGTSTGGILACGLLIPGEDNKPRYSMEEVVEIYHDRGDEIFDVSLWQKIQSGFGVLDEKYSNENLKEALEDKFGDVWLNELLKPCVITAYDTKRRRSFFFKQHKSGSPARNFLVREVAQATGAAPTYFEAARVKSEMKVPYPLIDGGVFANNPAMCAYAEARNLTFQKESKSIEKPMAKEMFMLSLGTGSVKEAYPFNKVKDYGLVEWIKPLISIMMSASSETVHYQLRKLFNTVTNDNENNEDYVRLEPGLLNASPDMDCATEENMLFLKEAGLDFVANNEETIDQIVDKLINY